MAEVLPAQTPDGQPYFSPSPLRRSSPSQTFLVGSASYASSRRAPTLVDRPDIIPDSLVSSAPSSPVLSQFDLSNISSAEPSIRSASSSSLSLDTSFEDDSDDDDTITFPSYRSAHKSYDDHHGPPSSPKTQSPADTQNSVDPLPVSDDTAIRHEPSQHVDYLSYDWQEEDIWSSWRHIVSQRKVYGDRSRLENASWRTWAKSKYKLKTVSPETLNWLKDHDVTWLYGPLQPASNRSISQQTSESHSHLSKSNSFLNNKKPILKKRSASEVMLQKSISASSLVKQAAAAVQAQQESKASSKMLRHRPIVGRASSDFVTSSIPSRTISRDTAYTLSSHTTSGLQTPDNCEKRHIRFDDKVEQCIAVDCKDADDEDDDEDDWAMQDDSSDDEGLVMMKSSKRKPLSRSNSRSSFSGESKTIAKLPSTTLKYRTDSPDIPDQIPTHSLGYFRSSKLSPSPSQETLRPSDPATNFLLGEEDDEDDEDLSWEPSGAYADRHDSMGSTPDMRPKSEEASGKVSAGLRRTESGMFMPYEDDDDEMTPPGIFGRVVDTVNTARDIAHVIWNVGWRK